MLSIFLTVEDIVRFARSRGISCQGRGSAADSAVCFTLGITEVDPARANAAMPDRTIIQWDKDDLDTLGLLKVHCLALGMLACST